MAENETFSRDKVEIKLSGGWYALEHWQTGPARWISQDASIIFLSAIHSEVILSFDVMSFHKDTTLNVQIKNIIKDIPISPVLTHMEFALVLEPGINSIRFFVKGEGIRPCDVSSSTDSRPLGVAFQKFYLGEIECLTHHNANEIDPRILIQNLTIEDLCSAAEFHYEKIEDSRYLIARPFSDPVDAPAYLFHLGLLFSGLHLGKTMSVLDFGAGSCWLSRWLNQMQCSTISVDCSKTALEMGKKLFTDYPIMGEYLRPPRFLPFDGHSLSLESESVDRAICFDTLHHVPNQEEVLRELFRVLKPGGLIGFNEPGREHSFSPESQMEMRYFNVLENNIRLEEIWKIAKEVGFSEMRIKAALNYDIGIDDYLKIISNEIPEKIHTALSDQTINGSVFFLSKGKFIQDSRCSHGLMYAMKLVNIQHGNPTTVSVQIENTGSAKWLHKNIDGIGVVKLGAHLYDDSKMLKEGFYRIGFGRDVLPGETITITANIPMCTPGQLMLDLVSEQVAWFEKVGVKPLLIS
jgi:2-polyprenyl-3-methyl-5-hydroxy-6-metoxy-1,4-benzoquinol methylase